ncbi:hypothetical protein lerEdw1_013215, partial [Lerista edwardsae]
CKCYHHLAMKPILVLLLYLGILVLPGSEGNDIAEAKRRSARFIFGNVFGGNDRPPPSPKEPALPDSSLIEPESFCQGGCREGWVSYMGQCYRFVQEQMTWEAAEVLASSK